MEAPTRLGTEGLKTLGSLEWGSLTKAWRAGFGGHLYGP